MVPFSGISRMSRSLPLRFAWQRRKTLLGNDLRGSGTMMDWKMFGRERVWVNLLLGAAAVLALALGIHTSQSGGGPEAEAAAVDPAAVAEAPLRPAAATSKAEPGFSRALTARSAFLRECGEPDRARRRIRLDHLFEMGCIGQLSAALGAEVRDGAPDGARTLWERHRADLDSVEQGGWTSREQPRRVRASMLSAAELMEKLAAARTDTPELQKEVAAARKAARSFRGDIPLAEQTERTDAFFRSAAEVLRLLGNESVGASGSPGER